MGGISQALNNILQAMGLSLPPWAIPALALGLMALFLPWIVQNMKTGQARGLLKRASLESGEARAQMEARVLELVRDNPEGRLSIAEACVQQGRYGLARQALSTLPDTPAMRRARQRLEAQMAPRGPTSAEDAAVVIERYIQEGLVDEARQRLGQARQRWPQHQALDALAQRL